MIFNQLNDAYARIDNLIALNQLFPDPERESDIDDKLSKLAALLKNSQTDSIPLIQRIGQLKLKDSKAAIKIRDLCALMELKALLKGNDPKKLADWTLKNKNTTFSENIFTDLSDARKQLLSAGLLEPEVGKTLSDLITSGLGLKGEKRIALVKTKMASLKEGATEALAHWINSEQIRLKDTGLQINELNVLAPYLHYVNFRDLQLDDPVKFIQSCTNAYQISTHSLFIKELKQLPKQLQTLFCSYCPNLTTLDLSNNPQLKALSCDSCPSLTTLNLTKNPQLKVLICDFCTKLTTLDLSNNPQLKHLNCEHCKISTLDLSNNIELERLNCSQCPNLRALDFSKNTKLQKVDCSKCPISILDFTNNPELKVTTCDNCIILTAINFSKNPLLKSLSADSCTKLQTLDLLKNPLLEELSCINSKISVLNLSNNIHLQKLYCSSNPIRALDLSKNAKLERLYCRSCQITDLDLSQNPLLEGVYCCSNPIRALDLSNNLQLKELDCCYSTVSTLDLSQNLYLKEVACNNCENLTSLGASLPNTLEKLSCENCPNLAELPQVPTTASVYSSHSPCGALCSFNVYPAHLKEKPKQVLLNLGKFLLQNRPFPNIVYMDPATGEPTSGIDVGGLRRQFVATLCESLFQKGSGFTFVKDGSYDMPTLDTLDDVDALRTFARLLGLSAASSLPTGTNLHPSFFHALFSLDLKELDSITYDQPIPEPPKKKLHMARCGIQDIENQDMAQDSNVLGAIAIVAKELQKCLGARFNVFGQNIDEFITKVQGSLVTKEALKKSIICENKRYKEWIDTFIDKFPKPYELKHFVMLLTGSYTLSGDRIEFQIYPDRKHLESSTIIHTCAKLMELPGDFTEVLLHKELLAQLSLLKTFNTA